MSTLRRSLLALASLAAGLAGCNDQPLPSAPRDASPRATLYSSVTVGAPVMLGSLPGTMQDIPHGINEAGTITGVSAYQVAIWATGPGVVPSSTSPTTPTSAADPGTGAGWGHDINNSGQIAGEHDGQAALWTPDGAGGYIRTDIPLPGSPDESHAWGINDGGKVVGMFRTGLVTQCFLWTPSVPHGTTGTTSVPGSDFGGGFCVANDINSLGTIAGASALPSLESHAFVWDGAGALIDLTPGGPASYGSAINDGGQVAGWRLTSNVIGGVLNAAIWTPAGSSWGVTDLGTDGHDASYAMDIDDAGFVVGFARNNATTPAIDDAFFWENGSFHSMVGYTGFPGPASTTPTALTNVSPANVVIITGATGDPSSIARVPLRWAVTLVPATPQGCIASLVTLIGQMQSDGTLRSGEAKSLLSKLDAATRQIDQGKTTPARNILYAFINEVNALVASGRLTSAQAQPLIDGALCAIAAL